MTTERPTPQPSGGLYVSAMEKERERQQQEAALHAKRRAEEEATAAEEARKRSKPAPSPQAAGVINQARKLRKEPKGDRDRGADSEDSNSGEKKMGSVFQGLFGRKDKDKDRSRFSSTSIGSIRSQGSLLSLERYGWKNFRSVKARSTNATTTIPKITSTMSTTPTPAAAATTTSPTAPTSASTSTSTT
jgi:hypothetical protein